MGRNQDPIVATTIPPAWFTRLQALAEATEKTQAEVVYDAIAAYLNPTDSTAVNTAVAALQTQVMSLEQQLTQLLVDHNQLVQTVQKLTPSDAEMATQTPTPSLTAQEERNGTKPKAKEKTTRSGSTPKANVPKISKKDLAKLQKGIPAVTLGRRLGVSSQAIANARKKGPEYFSQWSLSSNKQGKKADPDGLTWEWRDKGSTMKYYPVDLGDGGE